MAAVAVVAAVVVVLVGRGGHSAREASAALPHSTGTTTPAASSPSPAASPDHGTSARPAKALVGPVLLTVPDGWTTVSSFFGSACIEPQRSRPHAFGCAGLEVFYGWDGFLPANEMSSFSRKAPGWYSATDVQPCPVDPRGGDDYNGIEVGRQVGGEQLRPVGDRRAYYYQWTAGCQKSTYTFSPRAWYLPISKVLMVDYIGYPDVDPIVASARFDDGAWQIGFVRRVTDKAIAFDGLEWRAASNDFEPAKVHDSDPTVRALRIADDVTVQSVSLRDDMWQTQERSMDWLRAFVARHPKLAFHIHVTAGGLVDRIVEETVPPTIS